MTVLLGDVGSAGAYSIHEGLGCGKMVMYIMIRLKLYLLYYYKPGARGPCDRVIVGVDLLTSQLHRIFDIETGSLTLAVVPGKSVFV